MSRDWRLYWEDMIEAAEKVFPKRGAMPSGIIDIWKQAARVFAGAELCSAAHRIERHTPHLRSKAAQPELTRLPFEPGGASALRFKASRSCPAR